MRKYEKRQKFIIFNLEFTNKEICHCEESATWQSQIINRLLPPLSGVAMTEKLIYHELRFLRHPKIRGYRFRKTYWGRAYSRSRCLQS